MSGKKRGKYTKAINKGKDTFLEALFFCSEEDRFLISDNLIERACKQARCSERSYKNYFSSIVDDNGAVCSKDNKFIMHALADMVLREEKYYSNLINEYKTEPCHNEAMHYKYVKKITEHINENRAKYIFEIRTDRMTLFRLFLNAILVIYDQIPQMDLPEFVVELLTNNRSRQLTKLYFFWASRNFQSVTLPLIQLKVAEIFSK